MAITSIEDVVRMQLCTGCGACAYLEPGRYRMSDALELGRRPFLRESPLPESGEGIRACPGVALEHRSDLREDERINRDLLDDWGPVYGVWEGYSSDGEMRFAGSSGGAASALALFCLERRGMAGVLHTGARGDIPYLNETLLSMSRADLLRGTGSRYAPASPAEGLHLVERAEAECVVVGKPCDVAAIQNARKLRPALDGKIGVVIGFFCAGTPSTKGTLELLRANGIHDPGAVRELRYRGNGWPGLWAVRYRDGRGEEAIRQMSYAESWGFLQRYRQWRCYICPDHTGEFADIAVGDPWYRAIGSGEPGRSLVVARTKLGLEIIKAAEAAGYLNLEKHDPDMLPSSQPNLLGTRGALWGRLMVLRVLGAAVPRYPGFALFKLWSRNLSFREKLRSIAGTAKRVFSKQLKKPVAVTEWTPGCEP